MSRKQDADTFHCSCGKSFRKSYKIKHEQSTKHQEWIKNQEDNGHMSNINKNDLLHSISHSFTEIISVECLNENGIRWGNNGVGSRLFPSHNYSVIYSTGKTKTYSDDIDDVLNCQLVSSFMSCRQKIKKQSGIIGVFIHSIKDKHGLKKRPIRTEINKKCKKNLCVVCGTSSDVVPDHKNDLYNDERVLSIKTQKEDDFQTLCTHCNLRKRQVAKIEKETQKIYSAKNIPQFQFYNFTFPWEFHHYDVSNPKCKEHSYWYDPIEFHRKLSIYIMLRPSLTLIRKMKS